MTDQSSTSNTSSSTTSTTTINKDMPPPSNSKKRKRSIAINNEVPIRIAPPPPSNVALPPPLMTYHPHLVPSYYPVYHQHPYYLSVGPQPPISPSLSPTLSTSTSNKTASTTTTTATTPQQQQRILPKSPVTTPNHPSSAAATSLAPTFNYFPYPIQVSPQLHPTAQSPLQQHQQPGNLSPVPFHPIGAAAIRHNSVSSLGSTSTTTTTTADQREQARKISHSAIERRRRERINDKIVQLKDLIPSCADRDNLHKMTILQSAIEYITYLKNVVEGLENKDGDNNNNADKPIDDSQQTHEEEEEDAWSPNSSSPPPNTTITATLPTSGLKPMDLIKLNKKATTTSSPPPKIVIHDNATNNQDNSPNNNVDRHMNLENILC